MNNLKPCPFCGSNAALKTYTGKPPNMHAKAPVSYWVICNKNPDNMVATGCMLNNPSTSHHDDKHLAIEAWNTRATDDVYEPWQDEYERRDCQD